MHLQENDLGSITIVQKRTACLNMVLLISSIEDHMTSEPHLVGTNKAISETNLEGRIDAISTIEMTHTPPIEHIMARLKKADTFNIRNILQRLVVVAVKATHTCKSLMVDNMQAIRHKQSALMMVASTSLDEHKTTTLLDE